MLTCNRLNITQEMTTNLVWFKLPVHLWTSRQYIPSVGEVSVAELVDNVPGSRVIRQLHRGTALGQTRGQNPDHSLLKVPLPPQNIAIMLYIYSYKMTTRQKIADHVITIPTLMRHQYNQNKLIEVWLQKNMPAVNCSYF